MNPVTMTIINPLKEYWPSWGSNQPPPVLKSAALPTHLLGSATHDTKTYISSEEVAKFDEDNS